MQFPTFRTDGFVFRIKSKSTALEPEDEGTRVLRNVRNYLPKNTTLPRKLRSSNEKAPA
jgi:hypothetical protein